MLVVYLYQYLINARNNYVSVSSLALLISKGEHFKVISHEFFIHDRYCVLPCGIDVLRNIREVRTYSYWHRININTT